MKVTEVTPVTGNTFYPFLLTRGGASPERDANSLSQAKQTTRIALLVWGQPAEEAASRLDFASV